jgi:hypothetical protein
VRGRGLLPLHRVDELALALRADVEVALAIQGAAGSRGRVGLDGLREVLEVDDLDRAAGREGDSPDVLGVVVGLAHGLNGVDDP